MTIEEKAKAYDEALEKAKDYHKQLLDEDNPEWASEIEKIFPELKESEDEQHRKWILEYLYDGFRKSDEQFKDQFKCAIAWLEKQGDKDKLIKELGEYKVKYTQEVLSQQLEKKSEQKPAAWSEEDEKIINEIEESLLAYKIIVIDNDRELANYIEKEINWLKSLKGRVQPKK